MKEQKNSKPPALANWLVSKFINEALLEEFFGDLKEIYEDRITTKGKFYAKCMYWVDTLHLLMGFTSFNLFKTQSNPTIMYKHYLLISGRNLLRNKVYSIINVLGLAVGMGVCLTISQYVYFELSFDRFHDNYQNTYRILIDKTQKGGDRIYASTTYGIGPSAKETIPEIKEYVRRTGSGKTVVANPDNNDPFYNDSLHVISVDASFLQVFNFPLKLGNKESVFDKKSNIVITGKAARKYFGADNPIGKTLIVGGQEKENFTVSGVFEELPINSHLQFEALVSMGNELGPAVDSYKNREAWERESYVTYITLEESADLEVVHKKLDQLIARHRGPENADNALLQPVADIHLKTGSLADDYLEGTNGNIQNVQFFSIVAIFTLFIAWVNYINLSTARSIHRAKEVGVRKSIGAFRKQLISQFMMESVSINLVAAILSLGIAFSALPVLSSIIGRELPFSFLQVPMFWVCFLVVILSGALLSGLYPAFVLSAFKPISMLGSNMITQPGKVNMRRGLIVFQFLTSLLLIAGTYLVYKQITFMKSQELGVDMEKILVLRGPRPILDSTERANLRSTLQTFKTEVARHHSISSVACSESVPAVGHYREDGFRKLDEPVSANQYGRIVDGDLDFPRIYDFELIAGSSFTQEMSNWNGYVIINEEAVRIFGFNSPEEAIQKTIIRVRDIDVVRPYKVIGVVKNFHWHSLRDAHMPYLFCFSPNADNYISLTMNLSNIQESLAYIEKTYKSVFPGKAFRYFFLEDAFNRQYQADVQFGNLFLTFTLLAIFIACVGLFALVSYSATLRIKEFGIRKVFGAGISNIMMLLSREYIILLLIAAVMAIPAIIHYGGSWLENYAFRIDIGFDVFIIPTLFLVLISFLTVGYRTYSTAKASPVESLRKE